jgi:hypothetical protein
MTPPVPLKAHAPRHADLLADRAVWGVSDADEAELHQAGAITDPTFDLAAAAADLAFTSQTRAVDPMPASLRARILADANARLGGPVLAKIGAEATGKTAAASPIAPGVKVDVRMDAPSRRTPRWLPWAVAAAATLAAATAWIPAIRPASPAGDLLPIAQQRERMISTDRSARVLAWTDFAHPTTNEPPEIKGVSGDVVWSSAQQKGFMRLSGLRENDPKVERYQLWIIDERGLEQRVNGGLFDACATGETIVPFTPDLPIRSAAIFAVTIERPEGVVVSDMKRRACAAVVTAKGS